MGPALRPPHPRRVPETAGAQGPLPAVLALHDHGGNHYFGLRKITRTSDRPHPDMVRHQELAYGGVGWANRIAKRGYAVLVHDAFSFASRRVLAADLPGYAVRRSPGSTAGSRPDAGRRQSPHVSPGRVQPTPRTSRLRSKTETPPSGCPV